MGLCKSKPSDGAGGGGVGGRRLKKNFFFGADAGCVSRFLFLKFGI